MIAKKRFKVMQVYATFADVRTGKKMLIPRWVGDYESHQPSASIQQAAKLHGVPALLLSARIIPVCLEEAL